MLDKVRACLHLTTQSFDAELEDLIESAAADLGMAGVDSDRLRTEPAVMQAIKTYCRMNFGSPSDYSNLKAAYDEQKAQLKVSSFHRKEEEEDADV